MDYVESTRNWLRRKIEIGVSIIEKKHELLSAPVGTPDAEEEHIGKISKELCRMETLIKKIDNALDQVEEIEDTETRFLLESHYVNKVPIKDLSEITHLTEAMIEKKMEKGVKIMAGLVYGVGLDFMRD